MAVFKKLLHSSSFWSAFAVAGRVANSIILIPLLVRTLTPDDLGLWYTFTAIGALCLVLDFGVGNALQRSVSSYSAGVGSLPTEGLGMREFDSPNFKKIIAVASSARICFICIAIVIPLLASIVTFQTIVFQHKSTQFPVGLIAWGLYATGIACSIYSIYQSNLLIGLNQVGKSQRIVGICSLLGSLLSAALLILLRNPCAPAIGFLIGAVLTILSNSKIIKAEAHSMGISFAGRVSPLDIQKLLFASWKMGVLMICTTLLNALIMLAIGHYLGLKAAGSFGLTTNLFSFLVALSSVFITSQFPGLVKLRVDQDFQKLKYLFSSRLVVCLANYVIGAAIIILIAPGALLFVGSKTQLLSSNLLIAMAIFRFLELNQTLCAFLLLTENRLIFLRPVLVSALVGLVAILFVAPFESIGMLVIASGAVQLAWNNWWIPLKACLSIQSSIFETYVSGFQVIYRKVLHA
jgi:O-antigen/teichoic acid export membrane protein